jgi:ribosomal silencing factor RsfS
MSLSILAAAQAPLDASRAFDLVYLAIWASEQWTDKFPIAFKNSENRPFQHYQLVASNHE